MTTMLEKMARASYEENDAAPPWEPDEYGWQKVYIRRMRAALLALREPDEAMMAVYFDRCDLGGDLNGDGSDRHPAYGAFTAMIDAVLNDGSPPPPK